MSNGHAMQMSSLSKVQKASCFCGFKGHLDALLVFFDRATATTDWFFTRQCVE
jgi:hypothetical protein